MKKRKPNYQNIFEIDCEIQSNEYETVNGKKNNEIENFYDKHDYEKSEFLGKTACTKRINNFFVIIVFALLILLSKSLYLQVIKGDEYLLLAEKNRIRINIIKTNRGLIYDRNNIVLVKNVPNFTHAIIPSELPRKKEEKSELLENIAVITETPIEEIHEILDPIKPDSLYYFQPINIKDNIEYEKAIKLNIYYSQNDAVKINTDSRRKYQRYSDKTTLTKEEEKEYIRYNSISHILGYVGKINSSELELISKDDYLMTDYLGKTGIESYYEQYLRGKHGSIQYEVDAYGREKSILTKQDKLLGSDVVLTIDIEMQEKLEEILNTHLEKLGKTRASAVALNPQNGQIFALVSLPSYDNNDFAKGISPSLYEELITNEDKPLFFRPITGEYPSGSTFKLIMSAAALQEGIINENTTINSTGGIRIGEWFFPDWAAGGHGPTKVKKALAQSVNTFFYTIGGGNNNISGLGVEKINEYGKKFGLSDKLGIDLPNEATGFLPSKQWKQDVKNEKWYIGDTYHLAIGQGDLLVTPLQVAMFTSVFANNGTLFKPYVVQKIYNPNTNESIYSNPEILMQDFISQKNLKIVSEGLRQAVTSGSARRLNSLKIEIAGKTGTAQWHSEKDPHAWFTSYAPYDNPEIVLTILVEEGGGGDTVAVPIAEDFYKWWINGDDIEQEGDEIVQE